MYLEYFNQALSRDSMYAPALYQLYAHYFVREPQKAMNYFQRYQAKTDASEDNLYAYTDLLYLNKQYDAAISNAQNIMKAKGADVAPRIYKLLAYSYEGLKDTATAYNYMQQYFSKEADSNFVVKDYEAMATIYASMDGKSDSAALFYEKAAGLQKDSAALYTYYKKLADLQKDAANFSEQAKWLGKYYTNNNKATNIDLFNWGIAHYRAKEYDQADTVFGLYTTQYPEQGFGYYWRARTNTLRDSAMEKGLAIPYYQQMITIAEKDTADETNKKWLTEAYGYIAAYKTNVDKDYASAIDYFNKLLVLNPANEDAKKYISMLEKNLTKEGDAKEDNAAAGTEKTDVAKEGK
jgi:tetratricopeptide (TPR) repeat protein